MIKYIKGFDGIRAISILMVLITHLGLLSLLPKTTWYEYRLSSLISGTTGVTIFFTISGFLITQILLNEYNSKGKINLKYFFLKRILRLLPPYLILLTTIFLLIQLNYLEKNYGSLLLSFFYLTNFAPDKYYMLELGHTWSLAVEEQFYLIWPFAILLFKKRKILIFTFIIISVSIIAVHFAQPVVIELGSTIFRFSNTSRWLIPAIAPIAIGCSSAAILTYKNDETKALFQNSNLSFIIAILFFISPLFLPINLFNFYAIIQSFGVSILLLWIVLNQDAKTTNLLEIKPLRYIGKISYGLYVYQGLFLTTGPTNKLLIQTFPLNIILTIFITIVSYHFVENKFAEIKKRYFYN